MVGLLKNPDTSRIKNLMPVTHKNVERNVIVWKSTDFPFTANYEKNLEIQLSFEAEF